MSFNPSLKETSISAGYVAQLLSEVFGVNSPVYVPIWKEKSVPGKPYPDITMEDDPPEYYDAPVRFGQKTFGAFKLKGGKYYRYNYNGELKKYSYSDFLMPLASLVDFERAKIMETTPMKGGSGSVKEIYGFDDWSITINGIIIPDKENEPAFRTVDGQMSALQKFHDIAGAIDVEGQIFSNRGIDSIVTKKLNFYPIQGKPNMMRYSIDAVSDEAII